MEGVQPRPHLHRAPRILRYGGSSALRWKTIATEVFAEERGVDGVWEGEEALRFAFPIPA